MKPLSKVALTLFVLFQLAVIIILPNQGSILANSMPSLVVGYASTLGQVATFQFYAPNPEMRRFVEIEVTKIDPDEEIAELAWPPQDKENYLSVNHTRRYVHSLRTMITDERVEKYFKPWFCAEHAEASRFTLKVVNFQIPHIERVNVEGGERSFAELEQEMSSIPREFSCDRPEEEW